MTKYYKKKIMKDGSVIMYEYEQDSAKYYQNKIDKNGGRAICENCGKEVYAFYMEKHKLSSICKPTRGQNRKVVAKPPAQE